MQELLDPEPGWPTACMTSDHSLAAAVAPSPSSSSVRSLLFSCSFDLLSFLSLFEHVRQLLFACRVFRLDQGNSLHPILLSFHFRNHSLVVFPPCVSLLRFLFTILQSERHSPAPISAGYSKPCPQNATPRAPLCPLQPHSFLTLFVRRLSCLYRYVLDQNQTKTCDISDQGQT